MASHTTMTFTASNIVFTYPPHAVCKNCHDEKQNHGEDDACLFAPGTYFETEMYYGRIVYPDPNETTGLPLTWTSNSTVGLATTGIGVDWTAPYGK